MTYNPKFHEIYERIKFVMGCDVSKSELQYMIKKIDLDAKKKASETIFCTYTNEIENKEFRSQSDYNNYILLNNGVAKNKEYNVEAYNSRGKICLTGDDLFKPEFIMSSQKFKCWVRSK